LQAEPDHDDHAFVDLLERADRAASRIEIVVPGRRRIVVSGSVLIAAMVRLCDRAGGPSAVATPTESSELSERGARRTSLGWPRPKFGTLTTCSYFSWSSSFWSC